MKQVTAGENPKYSGGSLNTLAKKQNKRFRKPLQRNNPNISKYFLEMRKLSNNVTSKDKLVEFLYILMRDHLSCGVVEGIIVDHVTRGKKTVSQYSNGWLAKYAMNIARRLR